ncbi:MAG: Trk system potassium transporter TrkA [Spirochaetes bacterium]|nr:Trk system potassium transporter TrkA [Spirochaetota bacterium]
MKIIIVGAGAVGYQIANHLILENKDVVVIEKDPARAKFVNNNLDCFVVCGSSTCVDDLIDAGIKDAEFFICVTESDEVNMISCGIVSSEFNVPNKIARIRNLNYIDSKIISEKFLGIDYIVNPETEAAEQIIKTIESGALSDLVSFQNIDVQIRNINMAGYPGFAGKTIKDLKTEIDNDFLVAAIRRKNELIIPFGNTVINPEDIVYIVAEHLTFEKIFVKIGNAKENLRKIIIVGGGKIGTAVLDKLVESGNRQLAIIESDYDICKKISEKYPDVLVLNADIRDEQIFDIENIAGYDLIVMITNNEELNILSAIYAKKLGTHRAISLVINNNYLHLSTQLGIDSAISPKVSSVNTILKHIRKGNVRTVFSIFDGKAEISEFFISDQENLINKPIKSIQMPPNSLIIGISRNGKNIIPDGNFSIQPGDVILTITSKESINKIEKIFNS